MYVPFKNGFFLFKEVVNFVVSKTRIMECIECIKNKSFGNPGNEIEVAQDMLNGSLDQGWLVCLFFYSIPEPEYVYKRYAYKKKHVFD